jgi:5,10-methylenetetrahydrofolate reductase
VVGRQLNPKDFRGANQLERKLENGARRILTQTELNEDAQQRNIRIDSKH